MFGKNQPLIGLDIGSSSVKMVQMTEKGGEYTLNHFAVAELDPDAIVDGAIMDAGHVADHIRAMHAEQKIRSKRAAIAVSGNSVIVKKIHMPIMDEDELAQSITWEAEQYIPFEITDVHLDFHILEEDDATVPRGQMPVLLVAAKKDRVSEMVSLVEEAGLKPVIVDVDAFGLENIYCANFGVGERVTALVNVGASLITVNVLMDGMSSFTRDISLGGNRHTEEIQKGLNISFAEAELSKRGESVEGIDAARVQKVIQDTNILVAAEVGRTIDYFKTTMQVAQIDKVLLSGGGAKVLGLVEQVGERLGIAVEMLNPFQNIQMGAGVDDDAVRAAGSTLSIAAGLATRRVGDR